MLVREHDDGDCDGGGGGGDDGSSGGGSELMVVVEEILSHICDGERTDRIPNGDVMQPESVCFYSCRAPVSKEREKK